MAKCPICTKDLKLTIDKMVAPVECEFCESGPFRVTRASGYLYAFGLIIYFIFVVVVGVLMLGVDPSSMFIHVHNSGSDGSFAGLLFMVGFFVYVKLWSDYWSKNFARLIG